MVAGGNLSRHAGYVLPHLLILGGIHCVEDAVQVGQVVHTDADAVLLDERGQSGCFLQDDRNAATQV